MTDTPQRKLAAIVSADVVGYSRLMAADEAGTHGRLRSRFRDFVGPLIAEHGGRVVKLMGDGLLAEFPSVVDAVRWAVDAQTKNSGLDADLPEDKRIIYRVGVNLGDVIVDGEDIFGDGVNMAARLEAMAPPGGICISDKVHGEIRGKIDAAFEDGGHREVKNFVNPVHVWNWTASNTAHAAPAPAALTAGSARPDKPSIAVLPFNSLSADPEKEFLADGIVEDLITALARFPWLFVIARNSSFSYKGSNVPIAKVAEDLDVAYVVEGSVRSSSTRLRVSVQLIEAERGHHVWAENYDRPMGDLFDLQDEVTRSIIGVLVPALSAAERDRSMRDNHPNLNAWRLYQKGLAHFYRPYNDHDNAEARRLFEQAIAQDPEFSDAHAMVALMGIYALDSGQSSFSGSRAEILAEAEQAAQKAVRYDDSSALAHLVLGRVYGQFGNYEEGIAECRCAVQLNPNLAIAHHELGFILSDAEAYEEAIECFDRAISLSPNDPARWNFYLMKGISLYGLERFEEASICNKEAARLRPTAFWPLLNQAGCYAAMGELDEARRMWAEAKKRNPKLNPGFLTAMLENMPRPPRHVRMYLEHLNKDGVLE